VSFAPDDRSPHTWPWTIAALTAGALAWAAAARIETVIACDRPRAAAVAPDSVVSAPRVARQGLDLEIRVGRLRIEFPWMRSLPVTPARRIVVTIMPSTDAGP
jgi:hypothetical protein